MAPQEIYHTSLNKIKSLNSNPMFFSLDKSVAKDGWFANAVQEGYKPTLYKSNMPSKIASIQDKEVIDLFKKNNISIDDYMADLASNPTAEEILSNPATKLLQDKGYQGLKVTDYDPRDVSKDLDSLLIFDPKKSLSDFSNVGKKVGNAGIPVERYDSALSGSTDNKINEFFSPVGKGTTDYGSVKSEYIMNPKKVFETSDQETAINKLFTAKEAERIMTKFDDLAEEGKGFPYLDSLIKDKLKKDGYDSIHYLSDRGMEGIDQISGEQWVALDPSIITKVGKNEVTKSAPAALGLGLFGTEVIKSEDDNATYETKIPGMVRSLMGDNVEYKKTNKDKFIPLTEKDEPMFTPSEVTPKIVDAIAFNETRGVPEGEKYIYRKFSGEEAMGDDTGKYQITEGELAAYSEKFLGFKVGAGVFQNHPEWQDIYIRNKVAFLENEGLDIHEILALHRYGMTGWGNPVKVREKVLKAAEYIESAQNFMKGQVSE